MLDEQPSLGATIVHADTLDSGLERLGEQRFAVVLLDLGLPDSQGLATFERLHEAAPRTPVVVLTGNTDEALGEAAVQAGAQDFLVKGQLDTPAFVRSLRYAIERHQNREELRLLNEELERRVAERTRIALESEARYRTLVDQSLQGVVIAAGVSPRLVFANPAAARLLGHTADQLVALDPQRVLELIHEDDRDGFLARYLDRETIPEEFEVRVRRGDGEIRWMHLSTAGIRDRGRNAVLGTFVDVTSRIRWEEERARDERVESLNVLAGGIAHDFNNILTSIVGNVSLARLHARDGGRIWTRLGEAERALEQATRLVRQLMSLSQGGAPITETASMLELVRESAAIALSGSPVKCELRAADGVWAVDVDAAQMSRVVQNIVINADQAMPGGGRLRLSVDNQVLGADNAFGLPAGRYVRVTMADEGAGIPGDHVHKIFDPYFTTKQRGSGLGLAVAYTTVVKHGGHLAVESVLGAGTTFRVLLPASDRDVPPRRARAASPARGSGRVLVMDDEEAIREVCGEMLQLLGYEAEAVADGEEAHTRYRDAAAAGRPFDVVIADLTVPGGVGGRELLEMLQADDPAVRVIASSGYSEDPVIARHAEYGFAAALSKPYTTQVLSRVLLEVMTGGGT